MASAPYAGAAKRRGFICSKSAAILGVSGTTLQHGWTTTNRLGARRLSANLVEQLRSHTFCGERRIMLYHNSCLLGGVERKKCKNFLVQRIHIFAASPENQR